MYIYHGEPYLKKKHIQLLHNEPAYVKQRYHVLVRAIYSKNNTIREKASQELGISMRHLRRLIKRFKDEGISGLRNKSTRPHNSPNKTPKQLEDLVVQVREKTGFGSFHLAQLINISQKNQGKREQVNPRTVSRILVRQVLSNQKNVRRENGNVSNGDVLIALFRLI